MLVVYAVASLVVLAISGPRCSARCAERQSRPGRSGVGAREPTEDLLEREVQVDPSRIRSLVQEAIAAFPQETSLRVRLNPTDHTLLNADPSFPEVTWVADPRIVRPVCGALDAERIALWTDKLNLKRPREGSGFRWHQDSP